MANSVDFHRKKGGTAFILAMARGLTVRAAGKEAGIGESTAYERANDPVWQNAIVKQREDTLSDAAGLLANHLSDAISTLHGLLSCDSPQVAHSAARSILDFGLRYRPGGEASTQNVNMAPVKAELDLSQDALAVVKALAIEEGE